MKNLRIFSLVIAAGMTLGAMAQKSLTDAGVKAQKSLIEYLRLRGLSATIDTKDNSVNFRSNGVFYWVTFDEDSPVLYTIHRKGIKAEGETFKASVARAAVNEVNRKHKVKCTYHDMRVDFFLQTYAKEPSDFQGALTKMLKAFDGADETYKKAYDAAYAEWKKQSGPITLDEPVGPSNLKVSDVAFGNFDRAGNVINDYNQPLRKSAVKYIKASIFVSSPEKGIFKVGMKIYSPEGKPMVATKGVDYSSTTNVEIKKANKAVEVVLDPYGSDDEDFWKAGEYKVEFFDFEKGAKLFSTSFNIL